MAATREHSLNLDNQKRNVFVTQLHERDDEDDIHAFPVVHETGGKLLETGINTLQKTLLLKKQVEVDHVDMELQAKRQEFYQKMEQCKQKQTEILKKQQKMKDEFTNCEKYIKDYEAKRKRAIQKYQTELKLKEQKTNEYKMLCEQMADLKERQKHLEKLVNKYQVYETFLHKVIDVMPEDYIAATDDKIKGLMMRHRTLSESSNALIDKLDSTGDEINYLRHELDGMRAEHDKMKLSINSQLAQLQDTHEHCEEKNKQEDQSFAANKGKMREKRTELGVIMMAIDNITDKCLGKVLESNLESLTLEQKLRKIGEHVSEREDVARIASRGDSTIKDSSKASADIHKVKDGRRGSADVSKIKK